MDKVLTVSNVPQLMVQCHDAFTATTVDSLNTVDRETREIDAINSHEYAPFNFTSTENAAF